MNKILTWLLYITLFALQSYLIRFKIGFFPTNILEILIFSSALIFLIQLIRKKIKLKSSPTILISLILFISASLVVPIFDQTFFVRYWKFFIFGATLVLLFKNTFSTEQEKENGFMALSLGACAFGIFSIIINLLGYNVTFDHRLIGPLDSAVYLAVYSAPFFIFNFIKFFESKKYKYLLISITLGILLLLTRSMGAIVATSAIIFIYLLKNHGKFLFDSKIKKIIIVSFFIVLSGTVFYTKILPTLTTTWSSLDERKEVYMTAKYLLKDPKTLIFGLGLGQFQYHYENTVEIAINNKALNYKVLQPHNLLLLFIFNFGLAGALVFFVLLFYTAKTIYKSKKVNLKYISALILGYFFIHGILDNPYFKNDILFLILLFIDEEY